jgi:hypothetical protein
MSTGAIWRVGPTGRRLGQQEGESDGDAGALVHDGRGHGKDGPAGQRCEAGAGADPRTCADARGHPVSVTEGGRGEKLAQETASGP